MRFLLPVGIAALVLAAPVVIVHMLAPRRPPTPVSSLLHWDGLHHSVTAAEPWQKLRWSLLLLLQLLIVTLFAIALARPASVTTAELAEHTVFIVDASGSMNATDGDPDRLSDALRIAGSMRHDIPDGGMASLVIASARPTVLLARSADTGDFEDALASVRPWDSGVDYETAFSIAESLVDPERATGFVLISDGDLSEFEQRLAPPGTRFVSVGMIDTNRAITDLSVTAGPGGLRARVTVESTGGPTVQQPVVFEVDGAVAHTELIEIPRGEVVEKVVELPSGTRVSAYLEGDDLLAVDNTRHTTAPTIGLLTARVHGDSTFFVDHLLSAMPDVEIVTGDQPVDFEVYAGTAVPPQPSVPFIAIDVPGGVPGVLPVGRVSRPVPTLIGDDVLLGDIDVSRIAIAEAQLLHVEGVTVLLGAPGAPLLVSGDVNGVPFYYMAFTLEQSNLPLTVSFPILGARMVGNLAVSAETPDALTVGSPIPIGPEHTTLTDPAGSTTRVLSLETFPIADRPGFWTLESSDGVRITVAVNPDTTESRLTPVQSLDHLRPAPAGVVVDTTATVSRSILPWAIGALILVLAAEFYVSLRARGVSRRQWNWSVALRCFIVLLLALTLINPLIPSTSDEVTTVFVVDVSGSVGEADRDARAWVQSAISAADGGQWAVIEFGNEARVAASFESETYRPVRGIDRQGSSIARGLKLGESVLTGSGRQRIVLVSDGRANTGDLQEELTRLRDLGVAVDVHTVSVEERVDAAVTAIDMPANVNEGEVYMATVFVFSTTTGQASVGLSVDGLPAETRTIDVVPGLNPLSFPVVASTPGFQRLTAQVSMDGDQVVENDRATNSVQVDGPASVLLVEGTPGDGSILHSALASSGLVVSRVGIGDLPEVADLSNHQAVIMVDVPAWDVQPSHIAALDSYVRGLGRGLVVIGGPNSFGAGSYHETELEALLPVDSEAPDPTRQAEVAEVLLIDTSESMGACHCANTNTTGTEGGVLKTDIAKAATILAIEALSPNDEVGVLEFSSASRWVLPLQASPDRVLVERLVGSLTPGGDTWIAPALEAAAAGLRQSAKPLKHIVLFTDGFTSELMGFGFVPRERVEGDIVSQIEALAAEGISVSVVGTGEGAVEQLEDLAIAGGGRFYPGTDLDQIPAIFVRESMLASRTYINEGEFFPTITSSSPAVANLDTSPPIRGYVATTPKPTADVQLQVGALADPLLASWSVGLGRVTAWTSDAGPAWATPWAVWEGFGTFWSNVVRDTFPLGGADGQLVEAAIADGMLTIRLEGADPWPAGTAPTARVNYPDNTFEEIRLDRISDHEFSTTLAAAQDGTYSVGVSFDRGDGNVAIMSAIASRSYAPEFVPGRADELLMTSISQTTGGRGEILATQAFDPEGLESGSIRKSYQWWFLLAAALLWPLDVALRRLRLSRRERPLQTDPGRGPRPTPTTP